MTKRKYSVVFCLLGLAAWAAAPTWEGGKIVFGDDGTYNLDYAASASGLIFNAPATLMGSSTLTMAAPAVVYGAGKIQVPLSGTDGMCITNAWLCPNSVFPQKTTWTTIWKDAKLSLIDEIEGVIYGSYNKLNGDRHFWQTKTVAFTRLDNGNVTAQFHMLNVQNQPRAIKVEFRQNGNDVETQVLWAKHTTDASKLGLDWDSVSGLTSYTDATLGASTIGITGFHGRTSPLVFATSSLPSGAVTFGAGEVAIEPSADITVASPMAGRVDRLVFRGTKASADDAGPLVTINPIAGNTFSDRPTIIFDGIDARMTSRTVATLPPHYELVLTNNAVLTDVAAYANRAQFYGASAWTRTGYDTFTNALVVTRGCKCVAKTGDWDFGDKLEVSVLGGVLDLGSRSHYINRLILAGGGRVTGTRHVVGSIASEMRLTTFGEDPCEIEGYIAMNTPDSSLDGCPYVFDTGCDLTVRGGLKQFLTGVCDILKRGTATLAIGNNADVVGAPGAVRIEEGRLLLAANDAFSRTNAVTLAGGSLDCGSSTNRFGGLSLAGDSSIAVGEGQITFSDSSAAPWAEGATLSVTGTAETLQRGHVRFLSADGTGLSGVQLGKITYNGHSNVKLDENGWLYSFVPGLTVIVK